MTVGRIPSVEGGIQPTIVDAKGDLIAATASDTVSRLAVGTNGQVLTADSSTATGLKWAAAASSKTKWVQIATTSATGANNITFSSISGYSQLVVVFNNLSVDGTGTTSVTINNDTSVLYTVHGARTAYTSTTAGYVYGETRNDQDFRLAYNNLSPWTMSGTLYLSGCNDTGFVWTQFSMIPNSPDSGALGTIQQGFYKGAATVSSLKFSFGALVDGGSATLYGSVA